MNDDLYNKQEATSKESEIDSYEDNRYKQSQGSEDRDIETSEEEEKKEMSEEKFEEELKRIEKERREQEERRKKELERIYEDARKKREQKEKEKEQKQKIIAGQPVETGKIFSPRKEEGVFRRNKLSNFNTRGITKIEKKLKKVHGIPLKKKLEFINALKTYNPSKTVLLKKDLEDFARGMKHRRFTTAKFKRMEKIMDPRSLKFKKREIDKIRMALTGEEDPHKYKRVTSKNLERRESSLRTLRRGL